MRLVRHNRIPILMSLAVSPVLAAGWLNSQTPKQTSVVPQNWPVTGGNQHREFPPPPKLTYRLSGEMPDDVPGELKQKSADDIQHLVDFFGWQAFVAINWPVIEGLPGWADYRSSIEKPGPRLWESWADVNDVFLPGGKLPDKFLSYRQLHPNICRQVQQGDHVLLSTEQAVKADGTMPATLNDNNGHLVRYETRMNPEMFKFISRKQLYSSAVQRNIDEAVTAPFGSVLVKAAWREIEPKESGRFYTCHAWICDDVGGKRTNWRRRLMGLIGFHITKKTLSAPQWIWATFEQVDNDHPMTHGNIVHNKPAGHGVAQAIVRTTKPDVSVNALNIKMQSLLRVKESVFQNYRLISTQWPEMNSTGYSSNIGLEFHARPAVLANTTMESFVQETSSCIGCHSTARTARADKFVSADFTFTLSRAEPKLTNNRLLTSAGVVKSEWAKSNWESIEFGRKLTKHTYERLPQFARAKVHCESCHLDAARNPDASWWVGMI
ncbi:MAG: hypothetical protein ABJA67_08070, partial [Chthonomonadales bacterium]